MLWTARCSLSFRCQFASGSPLQVTAIDAPETLPLISFEIDVSCSAKDGLVRVIQVGHANGDLVCGVYHLPREDTEAEEPRLQEVCTNDGQESVCTEYLIAPVSTGELRVTGTFNLAGDR